MYVCVINNCWLLDGNGRKLSRWILRRQRIYLWNKENCGKIEIQSIGEHALDFYLSGFGEKKNNFTLPDKMVYTFAYQKDYLKMNSGQT